MSRKFKLAICQMHIIDDKQKNINKAEQMLRNAAKEHADMVVLPEMFNCPYDNSRFGTYSESAADGETVRRISALAQELNIYIYAGSIPECDGGRLYNTSFVFGRKGEMIGRHRKMHLFDIDIPGRITFRESDTLTGGNEITIVDTEFCRTGVAICYDLRFPELMRLMALRGAMLIVVPAAFNMVTGSAHWETLIRARAIDNQVYMVAASPARDMDASYVAYGNSMVADPWGTVVNRANEGEEIIFAEINPGMVEKVRNELPLLKQRREDIYDLSAVLG